jgi:hypothetical protein
MYRISLTILTSLAWLIASPSLQSRDAGWVEVGATPAAAQTMQDPPQIMQDLPQSTPQHAKKKSSKKTRGPVRATRIGSSGVVTSNQPGFYPMQPVTPPEMPDVSGSVTMPARDPRFPNVPTLPIRRQGAGAETSQDRVVRCTQQGALAGLSAGRQGGYVSSCAF